MPSPETLAEWVGKQRGRWADLTSFLVEESVLPQVDAGITIPCAGGKFYSTRLQESILGLGGGLICNELGLFPDLLVEDAKRAGAVASSCRFAVPAPHMVIKGDEYYGDLDEASGSLYEQYRRIFREMRDAGIAGHICIGEKAVPEELEALAGRRALFFVEEAGTGTLEEILEYQQTLVVRGSDIPEIGRLRDEFEIYRVMILDPRRDDLQKALETFEPDQVQVAGYSVNGDRDYWKSLVGSATVTF